MIDWLKRNWWKLLLGILSFFFILLFTPFQVYLPFLLPIIFVTVVIYYIEKLLFSYSKSWFVIVLILAVILLSLLIWVLMPVACDWHESWRDTPNRLCDCTGLMIGYYPLGMMDGTTTEFCIGIEKYSGDSFGFPSKSSDTAESITNKVKEQITEDMLIGNKKISFPSNKLNGDISEEIIAGMGVRNMLSENLVFTINLYVKNNDLDYNQFFSGESLDFIPTNKNQSTIASVIWDDSEQSLQPEEARVFPMLIKLPNQLGTYLYKVEVLSNGEKYAGTSFFVEVSGQASKTESFIKNKSFQGKQAAITDNYLVSGIVSLVISIFILGGVILYIIHRKRVEQG